MGAGRFSDYWVRENEVSASTCLREGCRRCSHSVPFHCSAPCSNTAGGGGVGGVGVSASSKASSSGNSSCFPVTLLIPLAELGELRARLLSHQQQPKTTPKVGFTATYVLGRCRDPLHPGDVLDFRLCDAQVSLSIVIPSFFLYGFILLSGWIFCLAGMLPWDLSQFETSLHICT